MERNKSRVLVIGSGFIGTALVNKLVQSECPVRIVSRHIPATGTEGIEVYQADLLDIVQQPEIWQDIDAVIYTLHQDRPGERSYDPENDVDLKLMEQVLNQLNQSTCKTFIYLSSGGAVYGIPKTSYVEESHSRIPVSAYGKSKMRIEDLLHKNSETAPFNTLILRPSNVYGNQEPDKITGIINHLIASVKQQRDFTIWGDGRGQKGYLHIDDLNMLILQAVHQFESRWEVLNVCSEEYFTPRELLEIIRATGNDIHCSFVEQKPFDVSQILLSSKKARELFSWKPTHSLNDYIAAHLNR